MEVTATNNYGTTCPERECDQWIIFIRQKPLGFHKILTASPRWSGKNSISPERRDPAKQARAGQKRSPAARRTTAITPIKVTAAPDALISDFHFI
ncbi:hypothetical protein Zmor_022040 [Zophobas morio]|uniref:Uncharacterized protein n=1 Tax=Zophobas morio TaxID=2755281 RepID=A0AA38MBR0_9CUCU|nr:hypothetical protein Zmor_022040 [Zophobas morio]